jgi:hypothetical protein
MPAPKGERIYFLEARQRNHDTGRWGGWYLMGHWYSTHRTARRERDRLNEGDDEWQCRLVTFKRERTYHKGETTQ